jgi:hypothetical protein
MLQVPDYLKNKTITKLKFLVRQFILQIHTGVLGIVMFLNPQFPAALPRGYPCRKV